MFMPTQRCPVLFCQSLQIRPGSRNQMDFIDERIQLLAVTEEYISAAAISDDGQGARSLLSCHSLDGAPAEGRGVSLNRAVTGC